MTKRRTLFAPFIATIALLFLVSAPICGAEAKAEERDRKECENFARGIKRGGLNVNYTEDYLRRKVQDNPYFLDALKGGQFSWENFWNLSPRAFFSIVWTFFLNPFSTIAPAFIGYLRYIPIPILKPFLYLFVSKLIIGEDDLAYHTFTSFPLTYWLNHWIFKFISLIYITWMLVAQCRVASLFTLASYTNGYTRSEQITLLKAIAAVMKEHDIDFNQQAMIIERTAEDYGTVAEENRPHQEKQLSKLYGMEWLVAFIQIYFVYGLLRFTHKSAGLKIYYGNALFFLYTKGDGELDEIIAYVEKEAPESRGAMGYIHEDNQEIPSLSVFFNNQKKQGEAFWSLAKGALWESLPFIDAEYQRPEEGGL